jgi:hypothetical protein
MRWFLLSLALIVGAAQSQEPPKPKAPQQKSKTEQRGTEQAPVFVKTPSPTTQAERDHEAYEKHQKPWNETALAYATIALCVITLGLAVFTAFLWNSTRKLVRESNDTARKELRAYVHLESIKVENLVLLCQVRNRGKTPAYRLKISFHWTKQRPQDDSTYPYATESIIGEQMVHPDQHVSFYATSPFPEQRDNYFFYGKLVYKDIYDDWWKTTFCYWRVGESGFIPQGAYNKEDGPNKDRPS